MDSDVALVRALPRAPSLALDFSKLTTPFEQTKSPAALLRKLRRHGPRNLKELFRSLDKDGSGTLEPPELRAVLQTHGFSDAECARLIASLDPEQKGFVRYHDFFQQAQAPPAVAPIAAGSSDAAVARVRETFAAKRRNVADVFRQYDANHDGTIDGDEFARCMEICGVADADASALRSVFDPTGAGSIDYNQFLGVVAGHDAAATELSRLHLPHEARRGRKAQAVKPLESSLPAAAGPKTRAQLLHQLRLTAKVANPKDLFRRYDLDGNGRLAPAEILACLAQIGWDPADATALVQVLDPRGSGDVAYASFFDTLQTIEAPPVPTKSVDASFDAVVSALSAKTKHVHRLFRRFDVDGSGSVDPVEFAQGLTDLGVLPEDIANVTSKFDPTQSGNIDFRAFASAVLHHDHAAEWAPLHLHAEKPQGVKHFPVPAATNPLVPEKAPVSIPHALHAHFLERLRLRHTDVRIAFRKFDACKLGRLDRAAFEACLRSVGGRADDIDQLWRHLAVDGGVTFHTFAQSPPVQPLSPPKPHKHVSQLHRANLYPLATKPASPRARERAEVQEQVLEALGGHTKGLRQLYLACEPDTVGVFAKDRLRAELQRRLGLSSGQIDALIGHLPAQVEERDLAACLHGPAAVAVGSRVAHKDAERIRRLEETHAKQLRAAFHTVDETAIDQTVHTQLSPEALSTVLRTQFHVNIPPERIAALVPVSSTHSQLLQAVEAPAAAPTSHVDFHGRLVGCRGMAPRQASDPNFLAHDMRARDCLLPRRTFPAASNAAGLASGAFGVRCSVHDPTAEPPPLEPAVAPRWKVKAVDGAHEKIGLGGGRKRMVPQPHTNSMAAILGCTKTAFN
ncbi:hypothetical protein ACHHYP_01654 [Achlya hypogyna]|uniref:EF-hand domain-containing protein n=1 Tax=Achlya hypogyna TaxID=1202772 RepID=A0A1V9Z858_ACHHY|nr:hypothetical protein ACHHYP_01654 [Achlya hypogyna]